MQRFGFDKLIPSGCLVGPDETSCRRPFSPGRPYALFLVILLASVLEEYGVAQARAQGTYRQKICSFHSRGDFERLAGGKVSLHTSRRWRRNDGGVLEGSAAGIVLRKPDGSAAPFPGDRLLPWNDITVIAEEDPGVVWLGTNRGAIRYEAKAGGAPVQYFSGRRWLPEDRVTAIGFQDFPEGKGVWLETPSGFSKILYKSMTLAEKARYFEERVRARHVRHGLTADSHLSRPRELATSKTASSDNDGLWTAIYLTAECFRFRVTGDAQARDFARQGIQALMRLESMTGIPGFPARSFIQTDSEEQPQDGEWHATADGKWKWKGDTSSDEIVGHYFAYAVYYDLAADEAEKSGIRSVVERISSHIVDNGYHLIDVDGKPTRWGWWAPDEIWADPDETGLRALHMLSHLKVAAHITGNPKFERAYNDLIRHHNYALLTRNQKINIPSRINHSDDELAFLSYYPLLLYETEPRLKSIYLESLERSWQCERAERNPLWNFIYAAGTGARDFELAEAIRTLQEIPWDLVTWTVANSHRLDVAVDPIADRSRRKQSLLVLPADERPVSKWNGNPYALDGGNGGRSEDDGAFYLLPYWLGRYHRFIAD